MMPTTFHRTAKSTTTVATNAKYMDWHINTMTTKTSTNWSSVARGNVASTQALRSVRYIQMEPRDLLPNMTFLRWKPSAWNITMDATLANTQQLMICGFAQKEIAKYTIHGCAPHIMPDTKPQGSP
jgi:hypothetical protein|mmetsp:Transcript_40721/g.68174  ORF Transcript_40721/g.68174 Transcript_40721/m.68174 type:complete len:126 (+) Transcript_40721:403-780(+)